MFLFFQGTNDRRVCINIVVNNVAIFITLAIVIKETADGRECINIVLNIVGIIFITMTAIIFIMLNKNYMFFWTFQMNNYVSWKVRDDDNEEMKYDDKMILIKCTKAAKWING